MRLLFLDSWIIYSHGMCKCLDWHALFWQKAFDAHCGIFCFHAGIYNVYEQPASSYMPRHPEMVVAFTPIGHMMTARAQLWHLVYFTCALAFLRQLLACATGSVTLSAWAISRASPGVLATALAARLRLS